MSFTLQPRLILNSKGNFSLEVILFTQHYTVVASVPTGQSTSSAAAHNQPPHKSIEIINNTIYPAIKDLNLSNPDQIDQRLLELDSTPNKNQLGANTTLAISIAAFKAASLENQTPLYKLIQSFSNNPNLFIPYLLVNMINGGAHGHNTLSFQEFHIIPTKKQPLLETFKQLTQIFHTLCVKINDLDIPWGYGDEGGIIAYLFSNYEALHFLRESITDNNFQIGKDFQLGLDVAANHFFNNSNYYLKERQKPLSSSQLLQYYQTLLSQFSIHLIEDPFAEKDIKGWKLTPKIPALVVADDLTATNSNLLDQHQPHPPFKAVIVKPNQIGTITQTIQFVKKAKSLNLKIIVSHRSCETNDPFIADFAVGIGADYVKFGNIRQGERVVKYNRLLYIESQL